MTFISVIWVAMFCILLMFKGTWMALARFFLWGVVAIKWVIIFGLVFSIINCPQAYQALGWTPLSLLVGSKIYRR